MIQAGAFLLTFDVESWYHANYSEVQTQVSELSHSSRQDEFAEKGIRRWIELLSSFGKTSTCFVLGEFAEKNPGIIKTLSDAGHEIATHLWSHDLAHTLGQVKFRESLARSKGTLENLSGRAVLGVRCPSWSYNQETMPWYEDELLAQGIHYDSSVFPFKTPLFGDNRPVSFKRGLQEVTPTVADLGVTTWPYLSGFFLRITPRFVMDSLLSRAETNGTGAMIVLHPRELNPDHPRLKLRLDHSFIHYAGISTVEDKLSRLLPRYAWTSIDRSLKIR